MFESSSEAMAIVSPTSSAPALPMDTHTAPEPALYVSSHTVQVLRPFHQSLGDILPSDLDVVAPHSLLAHSDHLDASRLSETIGTVPPSLPSFRAWLARVEPVYGGLWKSLGFYHAVILSLHSFFIDSPFISTASCFWDSSVNAFLFPFGALSPTLLDVGVIACLPIVGLDVVAETRLPFSPTADSPARGVNKKSPSWGNFISNNCGADGTPVSESEHIAFLLFWINRYLVCSSGKCVSFSYLELATLLARGDQLYSLGTLFLANLYQGLNRLTSSLTLGSSISPSSASGPLWFLTLWFGIHFPRTFFDSPLIPPTVVSPRLVGEFLFNRPRSKLSLARILSDILSDTRSGEEFFAYSPASLFAPLVQYPLWYHSRAINPYAENEFSFFVSLSWESALKP